MKAEVKVIPPAPVTYSSKQVIITVETKEEEIALAHLLFCQGDAGCDHKSVVATLSQKLRYLNLPINKY